MEQPTDVERTTNQFLFVALVGLVGVLLLLTILLFNYVSLHNAFLDNNAEILDEVDDLQETTNQLQETIDTLLTTATDGAVPSEDLVEMDHLLDELDENLIDIEDTIEESSFDLIDDNPEEQGNPFPLSNGDSVENIQDDINQTFGLIAWLIGGISLITAILLALTLNTRHYESKHRRKRVTSLSL